MNDKRDWLPPGTRLILASEDLLDQWGTRTDRGERISVEWGEQTPQGWYEPTFTVHTDDRLDARAPGLDEALSSLNEDDCMYDYPVAQSGEPMDPVLFVRWDALRAALAERKPG